MDSLPAAGVYPGGGKSFDCLVGVYSFLSMLTIIFSFYKDAIIPQCCKADLYPKSEVQK